MKRLLTILFLSGALSAMAQKNTLLDQAFWQAKPDVAAVKAEVAKGNSPSESNAMAMDPTAMALNNNAPTNTIKYLLDQPGNTVDKLTHDSRIYMHLAASRGNTEIMEYLFSKGSKAVFVDSHGSTPLTFAASAGQADTKVYDMLLAHGDNLKTNVNQDGANALLLAIANDKDFALTNYFVSKGLSLKSVDAAGNNAFSYAAKSGNVSLLKTLVDKGVSVSQQAILLAAQGGGGRRPGPEAQGGGSAVPASVVNPMAIFEYLESVGVKPTTVSKTGLNALHYLVRRPNQADVIKHFIQAGVDVNQADEDGLTPLMFAAAANRDTAIFSLLLQKVKNIDQTNALGQTALTLAVKGNSPDVVSYLINKGANVNVLDKKGDNLVYYAIDGYSSGERPMAGAKPEDLDAKLETLTTAGLNIIQPQTNGNTIFHLAVAKNNLALLKRLQSVKTDINAKNKDGITALHKAAMIAKDDLILKYLVEVGAKKDLKSDFDETAFDLASANETLKKDKISLEFLK